MTSPSAGRGQTREERWAATAEFHHRAGNEFDDDLVPALMALADSEQSDLRSRLAAAEAEADKYRRSVSIQEREIEELATENEAFESERDRLRAGIQALADEWEAVPMPSNLRSEEAADAFLMHGCGSHLRSLLSPANPQKDEQP